MRQIIRPVELKNRVEAIATEISSLMVRSCAGTGDDLDPVVVIGILSGGAFITTDLIRLLLVPAILGWARVQSYRGTQKAVPGDLHVEMLLDWNADLGGRRVLIVDDVLETGSTLSAVLDRVAEFCPRSVETMTLLRKPCKDRRIEPTYFGFDVPDQWVLGYGLDHDGLFRDLPGIWVL